MKNYDETINSVFERINEYEVEKKHKRKNYNENRNLTMLFLPCRIVRHRGLAKRFV